MSPVVRISDNCYERLQALAVPFTDTPAAVIERLLDFHDQHSDTHGTRSDTSRGISGPVQATSPAVLGRPEPGPRSTRKVPGRDGDEVLRFAAGAQAVDLRESRFDAKFRGLLKRRNYFLLGEDVYLIVKISRTSKPFYGLGDQFVELFNTLTKHTGTYFFIALDSSTSGWVLSKTYLLQQIRDGSISRSNGQTMEYKINDYNLRDQDRFTSIDQFKVKMAACCD